MKKKAWLAALLVLALVLVGCAAQNNPEADRAQEVIRVGDTVYTKGNVQDQVSFQLAYMARVYAENGMYVDLESETVVAQVQEQVITALVEDAVKNAKVKELGLDVFTEDEQAAVDAAVAEAWQTNKDNVQAAYFAGSELTGDELTAAVEAKCAELGVTPESLRSAHETVARQQKLYDHVVSDVTVTDEELQADLDVLVEAARAAYDADIFAYGRDVNSGRQTYYRPAGYRMIKQIVVPFEQEDAAVIAEMDGKAATLQAEADMLATTLSVGMVDVEAALAEITVTVQPAAEDAAEPQVEVQPAFTAEYDETTRSALLQLAEKNALSAHYAAQAELARQDAYAAVADRADLVMARLASGEDWDLVMAEESADTSELALAGFAVCEGFTDVDRVVVDAAMSLKAVGYVSPKLKGAYGYHIVRYDAEVTEGPVTLDEVREVLTGNRLSEKQAKAFNDQLAVWVSEAEVTINRDVLKK